MIENIIAIAIIAIILGASIFYIVKKKKSGAKCIGCPYEKDCASHNQNSSCNCNGKK